MRMRASTALVVVISICFLLSSVEHCAREQRIKFASPRLREGFIRPIPTTSQRWLIAFLAKAQPPNISEPIIALISPHAGYLYSGGVAAYSYALLKNRHYQRVVVIAPSHQEAFDFTSVYDGDAYATPLGMVPVDKAFVRKLVAEGARFACHPVATIAVGPRESTPSKCNCRSCSAHWGAFSLFPS